MNDNQPTPMQKIWQLGLGFATSNVIFTLVQCEIIEQLKDAPKSLKEISEACNVDADVLFRVLRFAHAIDLVAIEKETYALTATGRFLQKGAPGSLANGILLLGTEPWQKSWNHLSHALTTGEPAFNNAMGSPFFEFLHKHPEYGNPYNNWMTTVSAMSAQAICDAYNFTPYHSVCDIGGGHGGLLKAILHANPTLLGILFDQESVVKDHELDDVLDRVEIESGNFFHHVPSAEVLIMKSIIHDWDDEKSGLILSSCKRAMTPSSKLLLMEMVIGDAHDLVGLFYDLHMQVLLGGRERTEEEFRALIESAGLQMTKIIPTKSPMKIIEVTL